VTDLASAKLVSPRAARLAPPRWLDARLAVGVLLVLVAVVAGARVFAAADNMTTVYVAAHDLVPGQHLTADDVSVGRVHLDGQGSYYVAASAGPPIGYVITRYVGAHEFVPAGALSAQVAADSRFVTVPVQPGHLPGDLGRGDRVDVYLTPKAAAGAAVSAPRLVLSAVPVESREGGARTFSGSTSLAVVLAVPRDEVADVVQAVETGTIDLVVVPPGAGTAGP
jgi:Flp pilus assembly protein CpaB